MLNVLKWLQFFLSVAVTISLLVIFFPSIEVFIVSLIGCIYIGASYGAINNRRWCMWITSVFNLTAAICLSFLLASQLSVDQDPHSENVIANPSCDNVKVKDLPLDVQEDLGSYYQDQNQQLSLTVIYLLFLSFIAWLVVAIQILQWRWLVYGEARE